MYNPYSSAFTVRDTSFGAVVTASRDAACQHSGVPSDCVLLLKSDGLMDAQNIALPVDLPAKKSCLY